VAVWSVVVPAVCSDAVRSAPPEQFMTPTIVQVTFTVPGPDPALLVVTDHNIPGDLVAIFEENAAYVSSPIRRSGLAEQATLLP
jgi:hypothetical protein